MTAAVEHAVVLPALGRVLVSPILAELLGPRTDARRDLWLVTSAIRRAEQVAMVPARLRLPVQPRERVS